MKLLTVILTLAICVSCGAQVVEYQAAVPMPLVVQGVALRASLSAVPESSEITVRVQIANESQESVIAAPYMFHLVSSDSMMNPPVAHSINEDMTIEPGAEGDFTLTFKPVNNALLHRYFDLPGDLLQEYTLSLSGLLTAAYEMLADDTGVLFRMSDDAYAAYMDEHGMEKSLTIYSLDMDQEAFTASQIAYMEQQGIGHQHDEDCEHDSHESAISVVMAGDEIMLHERALRSGAYLREGVLYLYVRMFNRGEAVLLDASKLLIKIKEKSYEPRNDFSGVKSRYAGSEGAGLPDNRIAVLRNERIAVWLEYKLDDAPDSFSLSAGGFLDDQEKVLLAEDLHYSRKD